MPDGGCTGAGERVQERCRYDCCADHAGHTRCVYPRITRVLAFQRWTSASISHSRKRRSLLHRYHRQRRRPLSTPRRICDGRAHPALLARTRRRPRRQQRHHSPVSGARPVSCRLAAGPPPPQMQQSPGRVRNEIIVGKKQRPTSIQII